MRAAVAEADRRGLAAGTGYEDTVELLTDLLRISAHEARRLNRIRGPAGPLAVQKGVEGTGGSQLTPGRPAVRSGRVAEPERPTSRAHLD